MSDNTPLVKLTIDGKEVTVPKGTNLIEAALAVDIHIPFYCYHKHLSIAGNCRMCQVHVEGSPKLTIGCNTGAQEGMVVKTHLTSKEVADAQRATLEFLLINHPLDCTVCDQAGHCKLQDYYFEYNKTASRFIEDKTEKVKAEVLGPEVVYDGERCIVCTRCVRFCDEYTETEELSVLNRGDRTVIAIHEDKPLDNPFSGTVVDLCPVGALTHRRWRFNSRIWYSKQTDSVCNGCSTGCNTKVAIRDNTIVQVKARLNSDVNQEWLCDEGRYGLERFQPENRLINPLLRKDKYLEEVSWSEALSAIKDTFSKAKPDSSDAAVLLSPFLTVEELWTSFLFAEKVFGLNLQSPQIGVQLRTRKLSSLEAKLISPDYAPNARGAQLLGYLANSITASSDWRRLYESQYDRVLDLIKSGTVNKLLVVGDFAFLDNDLDRDLISKLLELPFSVALSSRGVIGQSAIKEEQLGIHQLCKIILPTKTINEKSGLYVNADLRLQKLNSLLQAPQGMLSEWQILAKISETLGKPVLGKKIQDERALFLEMTTQVSMFQGLTLRSIGNTGISIDQLRSLQSGVSDNNSLYGAAN